jgi:hypothetical protein
MMMNGTHRNTTHRDYTVSGGRLRKQFVLLNIDRDFCSNYKRLSMGKNIGKLMAFLSGLCVGI